VNLRERLRSMQGTSRPASDAAVSPTAASLADVADPLVAPFDADVSDSPREAAPRGIPLHMRYELDRLVPGSEKQTAHGPCLVIEWRYPLSHRHGSATLGAALGGPPQDAAVLLARTPEERAALLSADPRRIVYLDTETTGLAGGTGTYAFLVGLARYVDDTFVVRQLFMRELREEYAVLHLLAEELAECDALVTYNGKTYDWPLLETRYALGRRAGPRRPPEPAVHVDLLFVPSRLWRARLESCSLAHVEHHMLGVRRGEDAPGWLIPQLYFAYLRSRDARPLAGVFRHNMLDLLSLVALFGRVAAMRAGGVAPADEHVDAAMGPDELLALGRGFEEYGDPERALACYQASGADDGVSRTDLHAIVAREAHLRAGILLKRLRRYSEAASHWQALIGRPVPGSGAADTRPYEELAMYYEHVARDHSAARDWVHQALHALNAAAGHDSARDRARLLHRLARLDRTLAMSRPSD
jgi:uncharacterized protein